MTLTGYTPLNRPNSKTPYAHATRQGPLPKLRIVDARANHPDRLCPLETDQIKNPLTPAMRRAYDQLIEILWTRDYPVNVFRAHDHGFHIRESEDRR